MKFVSINGHTIRSNSRHGRTEPPIRIARSRSDPKPVYCHEVELSGSARLIYDPTKAVLRCGARLVLICDDVKIIR